MAVNRLLYASQSVIITAGGHVADSGGTFDFRANTSATVKATKGTLGNSPHWASGFTTPQSYLLPVQSASVDETVPQ